MVVKLCRKYISLYELLNMLRGIEDLIDTEGDDKLLNVCYKEICKIYDKSQANYGEVPRKYYDSIEDINNKIIYDYCEVAQGIPDNDYWDLPYMEKSYQWKLDLNSFYRHRMVLHNMEPLICTTKPIWR